MGGGGEEEAKDGPPDPLAQSVPARMATWAATGVTCQRKGWFKFNSKSESFEARDGPGSGIS